MYNLKNALIQKKQKIITHFQHLIINYYLKHYIEIQ